MEYGNLMRKKEELVKNLQDGALEEEQERLQRSL
jgi:hypothetical protein